MIVITTPTGTVGRQVVANLLEAGETVRVIARDADRIPTRVRDQIEIVEGPSDDPDVVDEAFDGADALFWLVPPNFELVDATDYYVGFTGPAIEAIRNNGVSRVVAVSSLGRDHPGDAGLLSAAFAMDDLFEASGVAYRSLAMPYFMENFLNQARGLSEHGALSMANTPDRPLATVATRDIASVAADLLRDRSWSGQDRVSVIGPDDLTLRQMTEILSVALDKPVALAEVTPKSIAERLIKFGASAGFAAATVAMIEAQNAGIYDAEASSSTRTATSFRQWCDEVFVPMIA